MAVTDGEAWQTSTLEDEEDDEDEDEMASPYGLAVPQCNDTVPQVSDPEG
jgi:hypothetical protein